ncbi:MAG: hypothetical protein LCH54_03075 [Bacteroidetes bacterium]|nr:hypothetical protein [Bacteroidota bacterium]
MPGILFFCFLIFAGFISELQAQDAGTATISGQVEITSQQNAVNSRSRGSLYRSRYQNKKTPVQVQNSDPYQDVVVYLTPLDFKPTFSSTTPTPRLVQKDVSFSPRVLAITVGSPVLIINEDRIYHNVFSKSQVQSFNIGKRLTGENVYQTFNRAGLIQVFCNIHSNMSSHILVLETPWFTKLNEDQQFEFKNIPDGTYKIEVFHPDYSVEPYQLAVKAGTRNRIKLSLH